MRNSVKAAARGTPTKWHYRIVITSKCTSMSSLFGNKGALISCLSWNVSDSTSSVTPVMVEILSQWRCFIALWAIISRSGQHSLKSSIVFLRSKKACHSFRAFGSLRILKQNQRRVELRNNNNVNCLLWCPPSKDSCLTTLTSLLLHTIHRVNIH